MKQFLSKISLGVFIIGFAWLTISTESCRHDPFLPDLVMPIDTMTIDTMVIDTMTIDTNSMPCDTDLVYFNRDILPILNSSCSIPECHDDITATEGIILNSYDKVIATSKVKPFNLNGSELYEVITDMDEDKRMPKPPNERLTPDEVQLIAKWILQGALNLVCDDPVECDTVSVSFAETISPLLQTNCVGCHNTTGPSGGVMLDNYGGVQTVALDGRIVGVVTHQSGFPKMPKNLGQLPDCDINHIIAWVNQGANNN